ncbi:MAG: hypothetical protein PHU79_00330 [Oscillospiraceae bacterium]|nr:hypothetical protein [Oscillospiraceae bacterium]
MIYNIFVFIFCGTWEIRRLILQNASPACGRFRNSGYSVDINRVIIPYFSGLVKRFARFSGKKVPLRHCAQGGFSHFICSLFYFGGVLQAFLYQARTALLFQRLHRRDFGGG